MLIPPSPFPRGRSGPAGFPSPRWLPCPLAPARHLMTYLNPPNPLFKGAHQAFVRTRAHGHRFAVLRPASDDALVALRSDSFACLFLKKVYHCRIHDATRKSLTINVLGVFRVGVFTTLKTVKQLSLSNLQVALQPSIKGQR